MENKNLVRITVKNGVAEIVALPKGVIAEIVDYDVEGEPKTTVINHVHNNLDS